MNYLTNLDYGIIAAFFVIVTCVGLVMARLASKNIENYYLGGRKMPWYMLGMSGMSNWFDLTGTMIITSFLFMMGPKGLYIEFRGGAVLILAFLLAYAGKWHRRSGCMTAAEWATYRFGSGPSGSFLRLMSAVLGIITTIGVLAYLIRGATLFMAMVLPFDPVIITLCILGLASLYTVVAGFYGVVFTDLFEGLIMIAGCIVLSWLAWTLIPGGEALSAKALEVTGLATWTSSIPEWEVNMPKGYEAYNSLIMAALFYLARNILGGMASGTESRFFAARNSREASMQCLLQGCAVMFRWPLMISFAALGIFLVAEMVPDQKRLEEVKSIVQQEVPGITDDNWHAVTSRLAHHPDRASPEFVANMEKLIGPNWKSPLLLVGPSGTVNPEMILPAVLVHSVPSGLRGFLIVSLVAALMGTLSSTVNGSSALFVRDIYQNFLRRAAGNRELIMISYASSATIVGLSFLAGLTASNINELWSWLIMGLTAGGLGPGLLRLYWWRTNAWGMAAGIFAGGIAAVIQRLTIPEMSEWVQFPLMSSISLVATIVVSLLTRPTPDDVVEYFYETTRPFGFWAPFRKRLSAEKQVSLRHEHRVDILTVGITLIWQVTLFLLPMQLLMRNWTEFFYTLPVFVAGCLGLYFVWYRNLPPADEKIADFVNRVPNKK
jgi:solute:Na+ symporter, SSS family